MDERDLQPQRPAGAHVIGAPLDLMSVAELEALIEVLGAEQRRVTAEIERKRAHSTAAESLFRSPTPKS